MESSRLPGKPLIKIDGKTMIQRVYESVNKSMLFDKVIVATPDVEIYDHVEVFGDVILTSNNPLNGTERVFEAYQKLEWNCQGDGFSLRKKIVTFRASGVRIRRNKNSPTLISSSVCQVPYLPWKNRYLSHEECLNIQGFKGIKSYPEGDENFYNTIGNAVNVGVISKIAKNLFNLENTSKK